MDVGPKRTRGVLIQYRIGWGLREGRKTKIKNKKYVGENCRW